MASILQVEQIQGPTSGASANTITIPSGQTLDINTWSPPAGTVLQVVSNDHPTLQIVTSNTSWTATGCSTTITPKSASSKILVTVQGFLWMQTDNAGGVIDLFRDGSTCTTDHTHMVRLYPQSSGTPQTHVNFFYYDSPNTTSAVTYEAYIKMVWGSGTIQFGSDYNEGYSITAMEIAQ